MDLRQFVIEGLGHISALIADDTQGVAAVVDPRRDVDVYLRAAAERGWRITQVVETHLHNDYVSGGRELAALVGARHTIGAGAELRHEHVGVRDGETFDVGSLRFRALDTPGHTPEHVTYAVADHSRADDPMLLFSGGSLLVGAIGRTDLLGEDTAEPYARDMFHSLHDELLRHEDYVQLLPTHGGGSLCSKDIATTPRSTIGYERRHNALLAVDEIEAFVRALLDGQPAFPRYFSRMRPLNQAGPPPLGGVPEPVPLSADEVRDVLAADAIAIDLRSPADYAVAHLPGAFSVPAGNSFGTWLGWVVPFDRPLVLVLEGAHQWDDAVRQALRIGYDTVRGYLHGGMSQWQAHRFDVESSGGATVGELRRKLEAGAGADGRQPLVLDVRQRDEYERGHVPGALHLMAGDLPDRLSELPRDRPIVTICTVGYRSSVAAGLLRRAGFSDVTWINGGVPAWRAAGYPVERGTSAP
ncbi:MAG TPA: MBL fold metallo-hydrolase [Candidatus Caenarcaniphilales bacterium]|nr:MBL fold metallo-hydrolase [Candidatus Caenarcaniphilales bacterium]